MPLEWVPLVRQGLPSASVDAAIRVTRITKSDLAHALIISEHTLLRRKREGMLSPEESGKLVRFARIVERTAVVFEDTEVALGWIQSSNPSLGGVTPCQATRRFDPLTTSGIDPLG